MRAPSNKEIKAFLKGLREVWVSDRTLAVELRVKHLRGGKITRQDSKEGLGVEVYAFGSDELGNKCAWCKDGIIRQFIG